MPPSLPNDAPRSSHVRTGADTGAGAILGLRFDSSGMSVMAKELAAPESLALDTSAAGDFLYWSDLAADKVQR